MLIDYGLGQKSGGIKNIPLISALAKIEPQSYFNHLVKYGVGERKYQGWEEREGKEEEWGKPSGGHISCAEALPGGGGGGEGHMGTGIGKHVFHLGATTASGGSRHAWEVTIYNGALAS